MRLRLLTAVLLLVVFSATPPVAYAQGSAAESERWHALIERLEPAAFVKLRVKGGREQKGTVLAASAETFTFQPKTRIPVPALEVRYADVQTLERAREGMSPGKKVLIGTATGVGAAFLVMLMAIATLYD